MPPPRRHCDPPSASSGLEPQAADSPTSTGPITAGLHDVSCGKPRFHAARSGLAALHGRTFMLAVSIRAGHRALDGFVPSLNAGYYTSNVSLGVIALLYLGRRLGGALAATQHALAPSSPSCARRSRSRRLSQLGDRCSKGKTSPPRQNRCSHRFSGRDVHQASIWSPGISLKSLAFMVTTVARCESACAAIMRSSSLRRE